MTDTAANKIVQELPLYLLLLQWLLRVRMALEENRGTMMSRVGAPPETTDTCPHGVPKVSN